VAIDEVVIRVGRWARAHVRELCVLGLGLLLRLSMAMLYDARIGYDYNAHWPHIQYIATRHALPPLEFNATACHPPLYHLIGAAVVSLGFGPGALGWLSAVWGMVRLVLIWAALERWVPESRLARVVALGLAAVLPIGVHLDGMITNETLVMLMSAAVFVVAPSAITAARSGRIGPMIGLALLLALALMSKVSASVLVVAVAVAIALEIVRAQPPSTWFRALRARALPLIAGAMVLAAIAGPFFVRNVILYGQAAPSAYEGSLKANQAIYDDVPYLKRRPLGFYVGWNLGIYLRPFYPSGIKPEPRFFPVLLASTFNDYYGYSYSGGGKYDHGRTDRTVSPAGVTLGAMSFGAGTGIALITVIAWFAAVRALWRRRADGEPDPRFALLLAPLLGLIGQVHFATKYANDNFGPIKGAYLQFVAPVLCALFGVGVSWMWRRRRAWRVPAIAAMGAVALVAAYSVHARWPSFAKGANRQAPIFATANK
jgi:hypothetical protein